MNKLSEQFSRQSKIEFEKYNTKVILEFLWWVWDKEKGVSLTWSATKLTIIKPNGEKTIWIIDFWMFQWWEHDLEYNEVLPFDISKIEFVIATHTHLDHIGKMLHLGKKEFMWNIWTTKINKDVLYTMLNDVIKNQPENTISEEDKILSKIENYKLMRDKLAATLWGTNDGVQQMDNEIIDLEIEYKEIQENHKNKGKQFFDSQDLMSLVWKINSVNYYEKFKVKNDVQVSFIPAGHLPGSSQAILKIKVWKNKFINIWFSGDLWKIKNPAIWGTPEISKEKLDMYMVESTYAWRHHPEINEQENKLIEEINKTIKKWWKIIIPVFMQWRAQEVALFLKNLIDNWKIPEIPVFYHSENIENINNIYSRYLPKHFGVLIKWNTIRKAKTGKWKHAKLNFKNYKKSAILLASGGMISWWSILNYLEYLQDSKNLFISMWYQALWTLWNEIFYQKKEKIEIPSEGKIQINANLMSFKWFSGHADEQDLLQLISQISFSKDAKVIINHGEKSPEQLTFWLAIKWIIWRTKEVLFADFNEKLYKK